MESKHLKGVRQGAKQAVPRPTQDTTHQHSTPQGSRMRQPQHSPITLQHHRPSIPKWRSRVTRQPQHHRAMRQTMPRLTRDILRDRRHSMGTNNPHNHSHKLHRVQQVGTMQPRGIPERVPLSNTPPLRVTTSMDSRLLTIHPSNTHTQVINHSVENRS